MSEARAAVGRWVWAPLLALSAGIFAWGLATGGFDTVRSWFDQLCTSCIGLTGR